MISFFLLPPEVAITPLADGRVAYVGDPVALVIADSRYIAEDAAALVEVEYDEEDPVVTIDDARRGRSCIPATRSNVAAQMGDEDRTRNSRRCSPAHRTSSRTRSCTSASRNRRWRRAASSPSATAPRS